MGRPFPSSLLFSPLHISASATIACGKQSTIKAFFSRHSYHLCEECGFFRRTLLCRMPFILTFPLKMCLNYSYSFHWLFILLTHDAKNRLSFSHSFISILFITQSISKFKNTFWIFFDEQHIIYYAKRENPNQILVESDLLMQEGVAMFFTGRKGREYSIWILIYKSCWMFMNLQELI